MSTLEQLLDREAIRDCLYRYCRGIDLVDEQALRSAYWEDASDCHGPYKGSASGFIEWALEALENMDRSVHQITNILIELRGVSAVVESKFSAFQRAPDQEGVLKQVVILGRYADLFEKRGKEWKIAQRTVIYDWVDYPLTSSLNDAQRFGQRQPVGSRWPHDEVYTLLNNKHPE